LKYSKNNILFFTIGFVIFNFILKIIFLDTQQLALDEPFSVFFAQMDIQTIIKEINNGNNTPFYFIILHYWIKLFGISPFAVRFLALIFASITGGVIFLIGNKSYNITTGIFSGFIYTFTTFHIYYSHEARVYSLFILLSSLSLYIFLLILNNPFKKKYFISLLICNLILIYSHYLGFFIILTELIIIIFIKNFRVLWKKYLILFISLFILYIPNIFVYFDRIHDFSTNGSWVKKPYLTEFYGNLNRFINYKYSTFLLFIFIIIFLLILIKTKKISEYKNLLINTLNIKIIFLWFFIPYVIMFFISYKVPVFIDRYIVYCSIPFYVLIGYFFAILPNRYFRYFSISIFIAVLIITCNFNPDNNRRPKEVAQFIRDNHQLNKIYIIPDYAYRELLYYYNINYFIDYKNSVGLLNSENIYPIENKEKLIENLRISDTSVILIDCGYQFAKNNNDIYIYLNSNYKLLKKEHFFEIYDIYFFERNN